MASSVKKFFTKDVNYYKNNFVIQKLVLPLQCN